MSHKTTSQIAVFLLILCVRQENAHKPVSRSFFWDEQKGDAMQQHHAERSFELPDLSLGSITGRLKVEGSYDGLEKVADAAICAASSVTALQMLHFLNGRWNQIEHSQQREIKASAQVGSHRIEFTLEFNGLYLDISEEDLRIVVTGNIMPDVQRTTAYSMSLQGKTDKHLVPPPMATLGLGVAGSQLYDTIDEEATRTGRRSRVAQQ